MSSPCECRECGKFEHAATSVMLLCSACKLIAYCSKDCQVKHWKAHKDCCKTIQSFGNSDSGKELHVVSSVQRRAMKSSHGDEERMNSRAQQLSHEARLLKRARRFDLALLLYSKAIELDPYNPEYYHHRGETWVMAVDHFHKEGGLSRLHATYMRFAVLDAEAALDLSLMKGAPYLTIIRTQVGLGELDTAQEYLNLALRVVPNDPDTAPLFEIYQNKIAEIKGDDTSVQMVVVSNPQDKYGFVYSKGLHLHRRVPELIVLDLEMKPRNKKLQKAGNWLVSKSLEKALDLHFGNVFQIPRGPWVTPIPLSIMKLPETTRQGILPLLGLVQPSANICVLKFDYCDEKPDPLSLKKAKAYLQIIVDKGGDISKLYGLGMKLFPDKFFSPSTR